MFVHGGVDGPVDAGVADGARHAVSTVDGVAVDVGGYVVGCHAGTGHAVVSIVVVVVVVYSVAVDGDG